MSNKVSLKSVIFIRNFICTCIPCRDHEFQLCQSKIYPAAEIFGSIAYMSKETNFKEISFHWYSFKSNSKSNTDESDACKDKEDALDKNEDEENTMMYGDIGEMLQVGEIALIKADDPVHFFICYKRVRNYKINF